MNHSTYRFSLDIQRTQSQVSIPVSMGDTAREWCISLTNGGKPVTIEDGCLAMMSIKRPTGTHLETFCAIEDNTTIMYKFTQNENTAVVEGIHDCQVTLYDETGMKIAAPRFSMVVSERVVSIDDINISDSDKTFVENMIAREAERSAAEVARVSAESARISAEADRATAEVARASAMGEAVEKANDAHKMASDMIDNLGKKVADGDFNGSDGVSVTHSWNGTVLTISSASGASSQDLKGEKGDRGPQGIQGERGPVGEGFHISATYSSIEQMNAGFSSDGVPLGGFALINTDNVDDEDNAKLFVKRESGYSYLIDMSGSKGIKGEKGDPYVLTDKDKEDLLASVLPNMPENLGNRLSNVEQKIADLMYNEISVSSFTNSVGTAELGSTVNSVTLSWKLNKTPTTLTLDGATQTALAEGSVNKTNLGLKANKTWTLKATDDRGKTAEKTTTLSFVNGVYYGVAFPGAYNSNFILGLKKTLRSNKLPSFTVTAAEEEHIYYCVPSRYGTCNFSVGGFSGGFSIATTTEFTNSSGYTEEYYVYKSDNAGLGTTTVNVT